MRRWLRSYFLLVTWTALRLRYLLPLFLIIQAFLAVGVVVGFAYLMPEVDAATARYLATGSLTLGLITIGMVMAPQLVAQAKVEGTFAYHRTLPVPRTAVLAADLTTWLATGAPGLALGLLAAVLRFDLHLHVSGWAIPALLLVALTATSVGFALAYALPARLTNLVSQAIVFVALMFSPINFPVSRLPGWLRDVHAVLPFQYMATAVRDTVDVPPGGVSGLPFLVLGAWAAAGLAVTLRVMTRRD